MEKEVVRSKSESKDNTFLTIYSLIDIVERDIDVEVSEINFIEYLYTSNPKYDFDSKEYYDFENNFNEMPESLEESEDYINHKNVEADYLMVDEIDFDRTHERVINHIENVFDEAVEIKVDDIDTEDFNHINDTLKDVDLLDDIDSPKDNIDYLDILLDGDTVNDEDEYEDSALILNRLSESEERDILDLIKAIDGTEDDKEGLLDDSKEEKLKDTSITSIEQQDEQVEKAKEVENTNQDKKTKKTKKGKKTKKRQKSEKIKKDKKKKVRKEGKSILHILFNLVAVIVLILIIAAATFFIYDSRVRDEQFLLNLSVIIVSFGFLLDRVRWFFT